MLYHDHEVEELAASCFAAFGSDRTATMTIIDIEQLKALMQNSEGERIEFKEAKNTFDSRALTKYMSALANEGGGYLILGVTNRQPRRIVGSQACRSLNKIKLQLLEQLKHRIDAYELFSEGERVVVFEAPGRPRGIAVMVDGAAWMRSGESLVPMSWDVMDRIRNEMTLDFSAEVCPGASFTDLDPRGVQRLRSLLLKRFPDIDPTVTDEQLLTDVELIVDGGVTYAALILIGSYHALGRYLANAEIIFEYRSSDASIEAQDSEPYREGFLLYFEQLWDKIDRRNEVVPLPEGFFMRDIPVFSETIVREALLNAVSHRDYRHGGNIFVRQYPRRLEVVSPGGFPPGIDEESILWKQLPRNRRLADALLKCGLVERAGQGADRMFRLSILDGKPRPDYSRTDATEVWLILQGDVPDLQFVRFLETVQRETQAIFDLGDLLLLDRIHRDESIPENLRDRLPRLRRLGVIESEGRGPGTRYLLSRRFYAFLGQSAVYTRIIGLDRETNKSLLVKHLELRGEEGCQLSELTQVLPSLGKEQVRNLLRELRDEGRAHSRGRTRAGRWFPGPDDQLIETVKEDA